MINIATSVVGDVSDRVSAVHADFEMVRSVPSQTFEHAPGVQTSHQVLVDDIGRWRELVSEQFVDLTRAVEVIHQAFIEADQTMAASWDVNP